MSCFNEVHGTGCVRGPYIHTYINFHLPTHMSTYIHRCIYRKISTHIHAHMYTYKTHTCIHKYIQTKHRQTFRKGRVLPGTFTMGKEMAGRVFHYLHKVPGRARSLPQTFPGSSQDICKGKGPSLRFGHG